MELKLQREFLLVLLISLSRKYTSNVLVHGTGDTSKYEVSYQKAVVLFLI
jgi:hypothetical protein